MNEFHLYFINSASANGLPLNKITMQADRGSAVAGLLYNSVLTIINNNGQPALTEQDIQQREQHYLQRIVADCKGLEWLRLMSKENMDAPTIGLDSIYTPLLTDAFKDNNRLQTNHEPTERLSAVAVLNKHPRLVLTGDPGSGKSVFVNYLSLCLAGEQLGNKQLNVHALTEPLPNKDGESETETIKVTNDEGVEEEQQQPIRQQWQHNALIPVRIILRDFAASRYFPSKQDAINARSILNFIEAELKQKTCDAYVDILKARLEEGEALVLFDGLDEVSQADDRRKYLLECIEEFSKSYSKSRILVTCRPYAYQHRQWQLQGFTAYKLAAFHRGQMTRFIKQWYAKAPDFKADRGKQRADKLLKAVLHRPALHELAKRPLLLSLIAYLHANRHELPDRRADLYERLLELLVNEWEKARFKTEDADSARKCQQYSLAEFLEIGQDAIRRVLERLAFQAHANQDAQQNGTADIAAKDLSHQLLYASDKEVKTKQLQDYLRDRVGILYQRGGKNEMDAVYTFPHRSFQEYLAAAYFRREEDALFDFFATQDTDFELEEYETWQELATYLGRSDPDRWREVIVLLGGIKSHQEPGPVWELLAELSEDIEGIEKQPNKEQAWGLRLAAEILAESINRKKLNRRQKRIFNKIQQALPHILGTDQLPAAERVSTGKYLSYIGDLRLKVTDVDHMPFSLIPAGRFYMGRGIHDKEDEKGLDETPAGEYDVSYDYWMAQYPVSLLQFAAFVKDTNYALWDKADWFGFLNSPVVNVSWQEAILFCQWLTQRWQQAGYLPTDWQVTLPDEAEWEKAARGGLQIPQQQQIWSAHQCKLKTDNKATYQKNPQPQRRYPWGNDINNDYANYQMHNGLPSTADIYPLGVSPYGCQDMAGNVWEWTRSELGDYPYPAMGTEEWQQCRDSEKSEKALCVLRGGAFFYSHRDVRCAVRFYFGRVNRDFNIGFRVILSPSL